MTPAEALEAADLLKTLEALNNLLNKPDEEGIGEISLIEDVSDDGHNTRAWVHLPEGTIRCFAKSEAVAISDLLREVYGIEI